MEEDLPQGEEPKPERSGAHPLFVVLYLIVFVLMVLYPGYRYGFDLAGYSLANLEGLSEYLVPAFFFSIVGIMTVRKKASFIYAICAAVIGFILLVLVYQLF